MSIYFSERMKRNFAEVKSGMKPKEAVENRIAVCTAMMLLVYRPVRQGLIFLLLSKRLLLAILKVLPARLWRRIQ